MTRLYLYLFCTLFVTWGLGFLYFSNLVSKYEMPNEKIDTDAIVVLTGGAKRIEAGIALLKDNPSKRLFITGIDSKIKKISLNSLPKKLQNKVEFGKKATNTFENASETKAWLALNSMKSITLVTATYHMPRSLLVFKRAMPELQIECYPVFRSDFKDNQWWKNPKSTILMLKEYTKYIIVLILF